MDDSSEKARQEPSAETDATRSVNIATEIGLFASRVEGLETTLRFNMIASIKAREALVEARDNFFEEHGTLLNEDDDGKTYSVPAEHVNEADKNVRFLRHFDEGLNALPNSTLVAIVSAYDFLLGRLVRWFFDQKPKALEASEKNIGLSDLMEFGSIEMAKEHFADREIDSLLRESHTKQFDWLEKKIGCKLRKNLSIWAQFIEITERRNLFVHADGYVSRHYLKICKDAGYEIENEPALGEQLTAPPDYIKQSTTVVLQLGIMLAQTLWRKVAPEELDEADDNLIQVIFEFLKRGRNNRALTLAKFGTDLPRWADESNRRANIVNFAQCYKWLGDEEKMNEILDGEDWSACSDDFQLCIAVLRDDSDNAVRLMKQIGHKGRISRTAYMSWPVFKEWRESEEFAAAFEEIFGQVPTEAVDAEKGIKDEVKEKNDSSNDDLSDDTTAAQDDILH